MGGQQEPVGAIVVWTEVGSALQGSPRVSVTRHHSLSQRNETKHKAKTRQRMPKGSSEPWGLTAGQALRGLPAPPHPCSQTGASPGSGAPGGEEPGRTVRAASCLVRPLSCLDSAEPEFGHLQGLGSSFPGWNCCPTRAALPHPLRSPPAPAARLLLGTSHSREL